MYWHKKLVQRRYAMSLYKVSSPKANRYNLPKAFRQAKKQTLQNKILFKQNYPFVNIYKIDPKPDNKIFRDFPDDQLFISYK